MARRILTLSLFVALASCTVGDDGEEPAGWSVDEFDTDETPDDPDTPDQPDAPDDPDEPDEPDDPVESPVKPAQCAREHHTERPTHWVDPKFLRFTPGEGFLVSRDDFSRATAVRTSDGEVFEMPELNRALAVSSDLERALYDDGEFGIHLRAVDSGRTLFTRQLEVDNYLLTAAIGPRGESVALLRCVSEVPHLELIDVDGETAFESALPGEGASCRSYGEELETVAFADEGRFVVATAGREDVWALDVERGELFARSAHPTADDGMRPAIGTLALAPRPGAAEVATTGTDGELKRWSLPELEPIGDPVGVGVFRINQGTFAPQYRVSPIAWGPAGTALAFVDSNRDVAVGTPRAEATLATPEIDEGAIGTGMNAPVSLSFSADGSRLGVAYRSGFGVFGCPGDPLDRNDEGVPVSAPNAVQTPFPGPATLPVDRPPGTAVRVFLGDEPLHGDWTREDVTLHFAGRQGTFDATIEVDDGTTSTTIPLQIDIE